MRRGKIYLNDIYAGLLTEDKPCEMAANRKLFNET